MECVGFHECFRELGVFATTYSHLVYKYLLVVQFMADSTPRVNPATKTGDKSSAVLLAFFAPKKPRKDKPYDQQLNYHEFINVDGDIDQKCYELIHTAVLYPFVSTLDVKNGNDSFVAYCDEEGHLKRDLHRVNELATVVLMRLGMLPPDYIIKHGFLVGPVILGRNTADGDENQVMTSLTLANQIFLESTIKDVLTGRGGSE